MRHLIQSNDFPTEASITGIATSSVQRLRGLRTYAFPPLVQIKTVTAAEFNPATTNALPEGAAP
jgi:hypothetical protein